MGNKSQHCVILFDAQAKNEEGAIYFEKMLESLYNLDVQRASSLLNSSLHMKVDPDQAPFDARAQHGA